MKPPRLGPATTGAFARSKWGTPGALSRVHRMLDLLVPDRARLARKTLHVVGSTGKGSVTAFTASLLEAAGARIVATVSPHVHHPSERLLGGATPLPGQAVEGAFARILEAIAPIEAMEGERFGLFEIVTMAAAILGETADAVVVEAGIGGRLDASRALGGNIAALVSVDLEHTALLGETEAEIARDKASILGETGTLLIGDLSTDALSGLNGLPLSVQRPFDSARVQSISSLSDGRQHVIFAPEAQIAPVALSLLGPHQAKNALLATALARGWAKRTGRPDIARALADPSCVAVGLEAARLPGRLERISDDPPTWIDVAHTPKAMAALTDAVPDLTQGRPLFLVVGLSGDKRPDTVLAPLASLPATIFLTSAQERRGIPGRLQPLWPDAPIHEPVARALAAAQEQAKAVGGVVLVAGGLFLAAEAAASLRP